MDEFGIAKIDARLMHLRLDQWRVEADEFSREEQQKRKKAKTGKNAEELSDLTPSTTVEDITTAPSPIVQETREDANHLGHLGILAGALEFL